MSYHTVQYNNFALDPPPKIYEEISDKIFFIDTKKCCHRDHSTIFVDTRPFFIFIGKKFCAVFNTQFSFFNRKKLTFF